jgi:hypothetical protein
MGVSLYNQNMRIFPVIILTIFFSFSLSAQQRKTQKEIEKKGIIYNNEFSGGVYLASNGYGFFLEKGKILNIKTTRLLYFGFGELRNLRLRKQKAEYGFFGSAIGNDSPKDFKQNNFYTLRFAFGYKKVIADKAEKNGVRVSLSYMGGLSLGILKPYYLNIAYLVDDSDPRVLTYNVIAQKYDDDKAKFIDWYSIAGASGFRYGLKEIKPVPGLFGKFGLNFDWSAKEENEMALEVGIMGDFFYKKIPIMIASRNKPYFLGAYISFQYGKRKFK